eukprot:11197363-Lingulodinium_polyedra.AAC.1
MERLRMRLVAQPVPWPGSGGLAQSLSAGMGGNHVLATEGRSCMLCGQGAQGPCSGCSLPRQQWA